MYCVSSQSVSPGQLEIYQLTSKFVCINPFALIAEVYSVPLELMWEPWAGIEKVHPVGIIGFIVQIRVNHLDAFIQ